MVTIGSEGGKVVLPLMSSYVATIALKAFYDEALLKVPFKHCYYFQLVPAKRQCSCRVFTTLVDHIAYFKCTFFAKKLRYPILYALLTAMALSAGISKVYIRRAEPGTERSLRFVY